MNVDADSLPALAMSHPLAVAFIAFLVISDIGECMQAVFDFVALGLRDYLMA